MPRSKKRLGGKCFDDLMTPHSPFRTLLLHTFLRIPEAESPQKGKFAEKVTSAEALPSG